MRSAASRTRGTNDPLAIRPRAGMAACAGRSHLAGVVDDVEDGDVIVTEEEAKTKWCPFARVLPCDQVQEAEKRPTLVARLQTYYNRIARTSGDNTTLDPPNESTSCIASACMAWRQAQSRCVAEQTLPEDQQLVGASHDEARAAGWVDSYSVGYPRHWSKFEPQGYCGLAGTP